LIRIGSSRGLDLTAAGIVGDPHARGLGEDDDLHRVRGDLRLLSLGPEVDREAPRLVREFAREFAHGAPP